MSDCEEGDVPLAVRSCACGLAEQEGCTAVREAAFELGGDSLEARRDVSEAARRLVATGLAQWIRGPCPQ